MPTTRAGTKTSAIKDKLQSRRNTESSTTDYTPNTLPTNITARFTRDLGDNTSFLLGSPVLKDNKRKRKVIPTLPALGADTNILPNERAESRPITHNDRSAREQRKRREDSPELSDDSLPSIRDLLFTDPETHKRIEEGAKAKFNLVTNKNAFPKYSVQIERLLSAEDNESLLSIKHNAERKECELKLFKRRRRADQVEIMWMKGEISKWKELARQIRTGDGSDHDSWHSRQGAFNELMSDIEGWKASREEHSSHED